MKQASILLISLFICLTLALTACGGATGDATTDQTITVGGLYTLSGDYVSILDGAADGVRMAVADFEAETGIDVKLIEEDDKSCADKTSGASKLVHIDGVQAIVGTTCSSMTLAVAPITEPAKTLLVSGTSTALSVSDAGDFVFRTIPHDGAKSIKVAEEIEHRGFERVGFIYEIGGNDAIVEGITGVKKRLASAGIGVAFEETVVQDQHDFRTVLLKMDQAELDVLVISFTDSAQFAELMQQWDELGLERVPVYTPIETVEHPSVIEIGGESVEGILFPAFAAPDSQKAVAFKQRFEAEYGKDLPAYAAESYDAAMVTLKAIAASDGSREDAQRQMFVIGKDFDGVSGTITFDERGDVSKPLVMKTIKDGEFVEVD